MARLTKMESEAKKAKIAALLAVNTPWAQIVKETGCSNQTIAAIANGSGNRSTKKTTIEPALQAELVAIKEQLRFMNGFFNTFSTKLVNDAEIMAYVLEHQDTFNEVDKTCQLS